jgi:3-keto-disaccharide hydrolase
MIERRMQMTAKVLTTLTALAAASILLSAAQQQAPARGGGGFRQPDPIDFNDHQGWTSLFDGKTLNGWSGDSNWRVENGAIVVESSCEKPTGTIYLVWQGGEASDFELTLEMMGTGSINGGVQYRGWIVPPVQRGGGPARGPQAPQYDFDAGNRYTGQFYEQATGRGIIAWKGQVVRTEAGKSPRLLATLGDQAAIDAIYKPNDWNQLHIIATGSTMTHILNGRVLSMLMDEDATKFHKTGLIGLEVEATGKLFTRNIWLRKL